MQVRSKTLTGFTFNLRTTYTSWNKNNLFTCINHSNNMFDKVGFLSTCGPWRPARIHNLFSSHIVGAFTREQEREREEDAFFSWRQRCGLRAQPASLLAPTALPRASLSPCKSRSPNWKGKLFFFRFAEKSAVANKEKRARSCSLPFIPELCVVFSNTQRSLRSVNKFFFFFFKTFCARLFVRIHIHVHKKTLFAPSSATHLCFCVIT